MIYHPLINPGQKGATNEENIAALEEIRSLVPVAQQKILIDDFIMANLPLVMIPVETYLLLYPNMAYIQDDLVSAGLVALTIAVHELIKQPIPDDLEDYKPAGWMVNRIIWGVADCAEEEFNHFAVRLKPEMIDNGVSIDPRTSVEVRDMLDAACQTPEDRQVMMMRSRGCTDQEVADAMDLPQTAIRLMRYELEKRYDNLVKEAQ